MIYVTATDGLILFIAGGGERAVDAALAYVIRRGALRGYLALRAGFAPNNHEPLRIVERGGRRLSVGDNAGRPTAGKWLTPDGCYRRGKRATGALEIAAPLPGLLSESRAALARRYPGTWARYERWVTL